MTELEVLNKILDALQLLIYLYLFFNMYSWVRRISNKMRRGQGIHE